MNIAIGIFRLLPRGGLEDHALRIVAELTRRGHDVTVHTTGEVPDVGLQVAPLDRRPQPLTNHGRMTAFAAAFERAARGRFDRLVGFQPVPGVDVLFLGDHLRDRPGVPLLKRMLPRFRAYARLEAGCFGAGCRTLVMGLARPQMEAFVRRYPGSEPRIAILPPTIAEARRRPHLRTMEARRQMAARLGVAGDRQTWLWLGLQPHVKGLDRVIEALALVPDADLLVAGPSQAGRELEALKRKATRLGVAHRIRWLGYVASEDVPACFTVADVLAHPARVDVTGAVILEAMINGLPVVATSCCGFAEHIELGGAGAIVASPVEARDLAAALARVCGPENAAMSANGIAYGMSADLYSGLSVACDLIVAPAWPEDATMAAGAGASATARAPTTGSLAWSR